MNTAADADKPIRHAPIALWRVAEWFFHVLCSLFGNPEDVAADHTYVRKDYDMLVSWLRCAEAMMRRLLLIEACAYAGPPASSRRATLRKPRERKLVSFYPDKPDDWRVTFRSFAPSAHAPGFDNPGLDPGLTQVGEGVTLSLSKGDASAQREPKRFFDAWPAALRYEALIRVFNDPVPFAKRLARSLRAKPQRVKDLLRAPPEAENRVDDFIEMGELGKTQSAVFQGDTS